MDVDVLIIGGGIAGLWTLDQLRRDGYRAVLVENRSLGFGQTITAQGIIHGGLKYSLRGVLTASANEIREMPGIWRECLSGQREPNLSTALVRSHCCFLWQTSALSSQAGMWGAQINLQVKPKVVTGSKRPELLQQTPGNVYQLNEQVISPASVLKCLKERNQNALLMCDQEQGLEFSQSDQRAEKGTVNSVTVRYQGKEINFHPACVVMSAGVGNALLADTIGNKQQMQRRPLQMVMARGPLPMFQGHCVDGAKTRLTITSEVIADNEVVWQLGGQIAEQGVSMSSEDLIQQAVKELHEVLPGLETENLQFATYKVDRAEKKIRMGLRPETPQVLRNKNVITCWPTKLAFAPRAASRIQEILSNELHLEPTTAPANSESDFYESALENWPCPEVAQSPWETAQQWYWASGKPAESKPIGSVKHAA